MCMDEREIIQIFLSLFYETAELVDYNLDIIGTILLLTLWSLYLRYFLRAT